MSDEWEQQLTDSGILTACYSAAIGSEDTELFAAVADDDFPDAWAAIFADDYEVDVTQDDGSVKKESVHEWTTITQAFDPASTAAVYLGGEKYQFCNRDEQDDITVVLVKKVKGGAVLTKGASYYIVGLYNEEKEQVVGNAIEAVAAYANYLHSS